MVDVGEGNDCTIAAIMYNLCNDLRGLYKSSEAPQDNVQDVVVGE